MIASTKLSMTSEDMCRAVAYWLNATTFKEPISVVTVTMETNNRGYNSSDNFTIELKREAKPTEPTP
jgi:hypothetical protein